MNTLELHALHKSFGSVPAVDNISLSLPAGSRTAIVGPSGSGKTTLLRMIAGFEFPDSGRITLNDQVLVDGRGAVPAHQRLIGYVPQDGALFPHLSVAANIGFGLPGKQAAKQSRIAELLDMVALDASLAARWPHELSGGQQQRVALARALAQRPRLMLLDEPFSALDTGLRASMRKAVARLLADAGITSVLVTHDQAEALSFADQLAVMRQGRLIQAGAPLELYQRPRDAQTAMFLGDAVLLPAQLDNGMANCDLGLVPVRDHSLKGPARIMLRPEQLQLSADAPEAGDGTGCVGVVSDCDFAGNTCTLSIRIATASGAEQLLPVRSSGLHAPQTGSRVRVTTLGHAHVLDAQPAN
ncbi:ATP-binding cassette domain-containing protein [Pseudomonas sp. Fl5BN2]|uniref:ABC transporter ATP-binding protein n=1 Tax=unclassified Pseudomonas TaxID=196821 RepID=UPI0013783690|nr:MULTISPECIES: ABC transporter ATP-binding protein [unclassified Pseudomonas]NBF01965.1 ATP-binding cassette domain-containing protein [Pseudomonas sp. Fl5BN2]NBF08096.1 ATP-binding cassette domain-containing protein [Pseudomonas sp. Fl4BN1]